jgi:hypothetical protein
MRRLLPLLCLLGVLAACGRSATAELPTEPPYLSGAITAIEPAEIRVEADPGASSGSAKAVLRFGPETRILWRTGEVAGRADLRLGTVVSAWVAGPVMESYPVQATAATIVIESTTRPGVPQV